MKYADRVLKLKTAIKVSTVLVVSFYFIGLLAGRGESTNNVFVKLAGAQPEITANISSNGLIRLTLAGEPSLRYVIESSTNLANWSPIITNSAATSNRVFVVAATGANYFRAWRNPVPLFSFALGAIGNINLLGNGLVTDSWNSQDTNQSYNGHYNNYPGTNGHLACAAGVVNTGNGTINGNVLLGPSAFFIGNSGNITGQLVFTNLWFPDAVLPTVNWLAAPQFKGSHTFTTNGYYIVNDSYPITVNPSVSVTLLFAAPVFNPSYLDIKGGTTNAGTVALYQEQGSFSLSGANGGAINNRPQNFIYVGLPGVTNVTISGTASFVGIIYAPDAAAMLIGGSGSQGIIGAGVFKSITKTGSYIVHFDESLLTSGPVR